MSAQRSNVVEVVPVTGSYRRWSSALIAAFLLAQIAIPLRYYLGSDDADERFAWRMFSSYSRSVRGDLPNRQLTIHETVRRDGQETEARVPLQSLVTRRWISMAKRERQSVIQQLLTWRASQPDVHAARLELTRFSEEGTREVLASFRLDEHDQVIRR